MPRRTREPGFTLLELMLVMAVLAVLFGLGIGFLGRTDPQQVAQSILLGELRQAQSTARADGFPTEVLVVPGRDGDPGTVQARLLQPVFTCHFEPGERFLDATVQPALGGDEVAGGRFGHGRQNRADDQAPLLRLPLPPTTADLREGFAVRLDVRLDRRAAGTVLRLGSALELQLDAEGRPRGRFRLQSAAGSAPVATVQSPVALPLGQWLALDAACDGREAWLAWEGRELARAPAEGRPLQEANDRFDVAPGDDPLPGRCDEVRLFVYTFAPAQRLPTPLQPAQAYRLAFDGHGEAIRRPEVRFVLPEGRP